MVKGQKKNANLAIEVPVQVDKVEKEEIEGKDDFDDLDDIDAQEVGIMSDSDSDSDTDDKKKKPKTETEDLDLQLASDLVNLNNLPKEGITINLGGIKRGRARGSHDDDETVTAKKKKKIDDINEMIRKSINRVRIEEQLMKHKLSLLLYLARGVRLVRLAKCDIIRALSMSIMEDSLQKNKKKTKKLSPLKWLESFVEEFGKLIKISTDEEKKESHTKKPFLMNLIDCYANQEVTNLMELVVMFVACLRVQRDDMPTRIVNVLRPVTLRANIIPKPQSPDVVTIDIEQPKEEVKIDDEDEEEEEEIVGKKGRKKKIKKNQIRDSKKATGKKSRKSPDIETIDPPDDGVTEKLDYWVEVYLSSEKRWCCVDLCNLRLDEPTMLVELSQPFHYLVSFEVERECIKPAERNYCENWYTPGFKKARCDGKWWDSLLEAVGPGDETMDRDLADETKTDELLVKQEMPTSDNGFRNHPLYVLEKHLLKYQGIYPPEVPPMGFFKDQPIYPRDCVHTLRSRETWLREARTVKLHETPYKIGKARPKRDKYSGELIKDLPLELFGEWQTEPYDPPEAKDGKVPRNCYGNVDMYQECMLPKGCAWLKLPGLPRVANKLGIDCAAAVIGFDNHCGSYGAHPVMDGFIVCKEHEETLQLAWEEEQENSRLREEAKRQKRIWDNWKRLIKAAQIREKLRVKYKNS